jgi:hypothetical protein
VTKKRIPIEEMIGKKFGRLTVIKYAGFRQLSEKSKKCRKYYYICQCECGKETLVEENKLKCGHTRSCGCLLEEAKKTNKSHYKHGMTTSRLYRIHAGMLYRCKNTTDAKYYRYGGRGISVCPEWKGEGGFVRFKEWALENGYKEDLTIDRIDNNKGYSPSNCRWASSIEQSNNRQNNHYLEYKGEIKTISQWARELDIDCNLISMRLQRGWSIEEALTHESRKKRKTMIPNEMTNLRNSLNARNIHWIDRTEKPSFSLLDLTIYRTWFMYKGKEWSVISGYGTYGGEKGLLEVMVDDYNPMGSLTAQEVIMLMDGEEKE